MIYVFIPEYHPDSTTFARSLNYQTQKHIVIRTNRKAQGIYWTKALNNFIKQARQYRGLKEEDTICIMNNDISFSPYLFEEGSKVKRGEIYAPEFISIDWKHKKFTSGKPAHTFAGRCFFMAYADFVNSKFTPALPHYLSDYDYGIRILKKLKPVLMKEKILHEEHPKATGFKMYSYNNPVFWTIFLIKHFNRYTFINILKAWYDVTH